MSLCPSSGGAQTMQDQCFVSFKHISSHSLTTHHFISTSTDDSPVNLEAHSKLMEQSRMAGGESVALRFSHAFRSLPPLKTFDTLSKTMMEPAKDLCLELCRKRMIGMTGFKHVPVQSAGCCIVHLKKRRNIFLENLERNKSAFHSPILAHSCHHSPPPRICLYYCL